jgi:antitoxin VapB
MQPSVIRLAPFHEVQNDHSKVFKNGQDQAIRISKNFEFKGVNEVSIRQEGDSIIIEPVRKTWLSYAELQMADAVFMTERHELL